MNLAIACLHEAARSQCLRADACRTATSSQDPAEPPSLRREKPSVVQASVPWQRSVAGTKFPCEAHPASTYARCVSCCQINLDQ